MKKHKKELTYYDYVQAFLKAKKELEFERYKRRIMLEHTKNHKII